jgi:hypothetical protein
MFAPYFPLPLLDVERLPLRGGFCFGVSVFSTELEPSSVLGYLISPGRGVMWSSFRLPFPAVADRGRGSGGGILPFLSFCSKDFFYLFEEVLMRGKEFASLWWLI